MKIGIDTRLWNETGIGRYIRNLVENLQTIDTTNDYVLFVRSVDSENIKSQITNPKWKLVTADVHWHSFAEQSVFLKILYQENLDLVHFPYFSFPLLYARPFVITIHDLILFHFPTGKASHLPEPFYQFKLLAYKRLMHHASLHARKIIAVSHATKDEIVDHLHTDPKKVIVTYEGVGIQTSQTKPVNKALRKPYFLYVGNAYPHKNLDKLLKAFAQFTKEIHQINLLLVGKEDYFYAEIKRRLLTFGIEKSVIILPNISDEQLVFLYKHAIGLVMPSLMEGFGLPALEAMKNNCLVIASNIPSLKEICQDSAIYFDPHDREAIVTTLKKVYFGQTTFNNNKKIGLERVKLFSWEKMAEETIHVYESSISIRQS